MTRILVFYIFTVQTCNDNYIFKTRVISTPYTLKLRKNVAFFSKVLLTDIYISMISLRMNEQLSAFSQKNHPYAKGMLNWGSVLCAGGRRGILVPSAFH